MTNEQAIAKALTTKLKNRYYAENGNIDLDFIEDSIKVAIEELRGRDIPETLADLIPAVKKPEGKVVNDFTSQVIFRARKALYDIMSEVITNLEFDVDGFISAIVYWYEFQQLAKAYGKKIIYFTPKAKKGEK